MYSNLDNEAINRFLKSLPSLAQLAPTGALNLPKRMGALDASMITDLGRRTDRLDRCCDWTMQLSRNMTRIDGDDEEGEFTFLDQTKINRPTYGRRGMIRGRGRMYTRPNALASGLGAGGGAQLKATKSLINLERERERQYLKIRKQYNYRTGGPGPGAPGGTDRPQVLKREPSIQIKPEWILKEEINLQQLNRLNLHVANPVELAECGQIGCYNSLFDSTTTKREAKLAKTDVLPLKDETTTDDLTIRLTNVHLGLCRTHLMSQSLSKWTCCQIEHYVTTTQMST
ncbi:hypothetical protein ACOME3_004416 [Neoechinorhynchus agilis]